MADRLDAIEALREALHRWGKVLDPDETAIWDAAVRELDGLVGRVRDLEHELRREWWLHHGHDFAALYGDDGEMQCSACPADFKRLPLDELRLVVMRGKALAASGEEPA